jgi:hypothetical protein
VLLFATLGSVMTGYRAKLSPFTGYEGGTLFPVSQLVGPRIRLYDGARVGLSDAHMFSHDAIVYPDGISDEYNVGDPSYGYSIGEFLASSRDFKEPWGVLVDCQSYACLLSSLAIAELTVCRQITTPA